MEKRLIDVNNAISVLKILSYKCYDDNAFKQAISVLESVPTVDAVEVVRGEWIIDGMNEYELSYGCVGYEPIYRCSKCGITTESYLRTERPIMPEDADFPNYCPYCGAKMDGERRDANGI